MSNLPRVLSLICDIDKYIIWTWIQSLIKSNLLKLFISLIQILLKINKFYTMVKGINYGADAVLFGRIMNWTNTGTYVYWTFISYA